MGGKRQTVNLRQLAELAGVSEATVSLAVNGRPGVAVATRERVVPMAARYGYRPSHLARSLALQSPRALGLVVPDIENPFFGALARHVDDHARAAGYSLSLAVSGDDLGREEGIIADFASRQVDGIVHVPAQQTRRDFAVFAALRRGGTPLVCATNYYPDYPSPVVMTDYAGAMAELARHVLARGRRRVVFLGSHDPEAPIAKLRAEGCRRACAAVGAPFPDDAVIACARPDFESGRAAAAKLLAESRPDAILAINDIVALGALRAAREAGIAVPETLAVAGFDDLVFAAVAEVPLTTMRQDISELAAQAVAMVVGGGVIRQDWEISKIPAAIVLRASA